MSDLLKEDVDSFYYSKAAVAIPATSALVSFFSSSLIFWLVVKSRTNSSYHRIMLFMSFWDMTLSACFAFVTIPMPKENIYDFATPSYGTVGTCNLQGFLSHFGIAMVLSSNMLLNIYYLCTLRYHVSELTMKKYIEPSFLVVFTGAALFLPLFSIQYEYFNPSIYYPSCSITPYPTDCNNEDIPCIRGDPLSIRTSNILRAFIFFWAGSLLLTIMVSMALIILTFVTLEQKARRAMKRGTSTEEQSCEENGEMQSNSEGAIIFVQSNRVVTRKLTKQALMYFGAAFLSWASLFGTIFVNDGRGVAIVYRIFFPLQGFFNALIFIYHKVDILKRCNSNALSNWEALRMVFEKPSETPQIYISNRRLDDDGNHGLDEDE
jgi:hypothetical protein